MAGPLRRIMSSKKQAAANRYLLQLIIRKNCLFLKSVFILPGRRYKKIFVLHQGRLLLLDYIFAPYFFIWKE